MLSKVLLLFLLLLLSRPAPAITIAVSEFDLDTPFELKPADPAPTSLTLQLANAGPNAVELSAAQVALGVLGMSGSIGEVTVTHRTGADSLFGSEAVDISNVPGIITLQAGSLSPVSLGQDERGVLAEIEIAVAPGASGVFELLARDIGVSEPQTSSHWTPFGFPPTRQSYDNTASAVAGGILLGRIIVVPEANSMMLTTLASVGLRLVSTSPRVRRVAASPIGTR